MLKNPITFVINASLGKAAPLVFFRQQHNNGNPDENPSALAALHLPLAQTHPKANSFDFTIAPQRNRLTLSISSRCDRELVG
jgi:hypothetical protein